MCLSIPSKIKSIDLEMNTCIVDTMELNEVQVWI